MSADLILAIDQGTTGTTCLLVDPDLRVLAQAKHEFPQHFPEPGWVEHDPEELWASVLAGISDVFERSGAAPERVAAIGITNQRETTLLWERSTGQRVHRAIVWQDRRTAAMCEALQRAGHQERVARITGLRLDPYFSGTKLAWMLEHVPGAREAAEAGALAAGTVDTYLLWRLTSGASHMTEPSNASRTLLWPLEGGDWSDEMCELFGVPRALLPTVAPCTAEFGRTRGVTGLPDGIPILGIAGDQQAALFGQACFDEGEAKCTYGTGAFVVLNTGSRIVPSKHDLLTSVAWQIGHETTYCLEGSAFMAGAVIQWLRDNLGIIEHAAEVEALANTVADSAGVVLVPGHAGLGAPHWRPHARGIIRGLTRGTGRAHIARAALEGIALQIADLVDAMSADAGKPVAVLKVDGGAAANDLLMQIQADLLGIPLERPSMQEATALGAVFMAGLGAGIWPDSSSLRATWKRQRRFDPTVDADTLAPLRERWREAIQRA
jgi:glycerol kinase